jgi:hypothetical protein
MTKESKREKQLKKIYPDDELYRKERLRIIQVDRDMIKFMKKQIILSERNLNRNKSILEYYKNSIKELHPRRNLAQ